MRIFHNNLEITNKIDRLDDNEYSLSYTVGDYIYVGSDFPFNHLYFKIGATANAVSTNMSVQYFGSLWSTMIELRDETRALTNDGYIEFTPNRNYAWTMPIDSTQANVGISTTVYYKYWTRISFDQNFTSSLNFIGHKFSDDMDLFGEYPIFDDTTLMTAFKAGKETWEEQHIKASELIAQDLRKKGIASSLEQVIDRKRFLGASVAKVAEIIFNSFGVDYVAQKKLSRAEYDLRLDMKQFEIDANNNAILEPYEVSASQGWLSR